MHPLFLKGPPHHPHRLHNGAYLLRTFPSPHLAFRRGCGEDAAPGAVVIHYVSVP